MFWHLLLVLLSPLASLLSGLLRDDGDRQILALRQQVLILQRQLSKCPHLHWAEKRTRLLACARMKQRQLLHCHMIVKPATLIGRHRQIVRQHWTFRPTRLGERYDQRCSCPKWDARSCQRGIGGAVSPVAGDQPPITCGGASSFPGHEREPHPPESAKKNRPAVSAPSPAPSPCPAWSTCRPAWSVFRTNLESAPLVLTPGGSRRQLRATLLPSCTRASESASSQPEEPDPLATQTPPQSETSAHGEGAGRGLDGCSSGMGGGGGRWGPAGEDSPGWAH